jgi:copper chaperone CopZ
VRSALEKVPGVERAQVKMPDSALVSGTADPATLIAAIKKAGFDASLRSSD